MSKPLNRAEYYCSLANEYRRLAADSSAETRHYYLYLANNYSTLAESVKLKTTQEGREQRLASSQSRSNGWPLAHASYH
jgi:hypothetical protein